MESDSVIRVLVVDDREVVAAGLEAVIDGEPGYAVVGIASGHDDALVQIEATTPDVALVDSEAPAGVDLCAEVRTAHPTTKCLLYGSQAHERVVLDTVRSGAGGFLLMSSSRARLFAALRAVSAGESFLDPGVTQLLFEQLRHGDPADPIAFLSTSERELLRHLCAGLSNREIAARMYLSEKTIKNYVSRLLRKLDLRRRTEAVAFSAALAEHSAPFGSAASAR